MNLNRLLVMTVLVLSVSLMGCSSEMGMKQPLYNPNFISTLLHKDVMPEEPARHSKLTMEPAIKLCNAYHKEISALGDVTGSAEKKQQAAVIARKYLPNALKLQKDMLQAGDAIIPHVRYMMQINNYVDSLVAELQMIEVGNFQADKIAEFRETEDISLIGYKHYKMILTKGVQEYQLSVGLISGLKKGMSYRHVVDRLNMPGELVRDGEYVWLHNDAYLFASFKNGGLDFWKLYGAY